MITDRPAPVPSNNPTEVTTSDDHANVRIPVYAYQTDGDMQHVGELVLPITFGDPYAAHSIDAPQPGDPYTVSVTCPLPGPMTLRVHPVPVSFCDVVPRTEYDAACQTIAAMHAAAVGEVRGPTRGVVEDITDLRVRCHAAEEALGRLQQTLETERERHAATRAQLADRPVTGPDCAELAGRLLHEAARHATAGDPERSMALMNVAGGWADLGIAVATHQALTRPDATQADR